MKFVARVLLFPVVLLSAFLVLMLKWTLNLSAFVLALPMLYIFGCGLYTLYCLDAVFDLAGGRVWLLCSDLHGGLDRGCGGAF